MKKYILFLFFIFPTLLKAQNIDTVQVKSLTMQAQDWAWLVGQMPENDSINITTIRAIRTKVKTISNLTWTTNVTLDSIPGSIAVRLYATTVYGAAGEIAARYTAIRSALSSKTNIAYWIGLIDGSQSTQFDNKRNLGKNKVID